MLRTNHNLVWTRQDTAFNRYYTLLLSISIFYIYDCCQINVEEFWRGQSKNGQDEEKQNTTQYVLDTTICKQTQIKYTCVWCWNF